MSLEVVNLSDFTKAKIGRNVVIKAKSFHAVGGFEIGDDVYIEAEKITLGDNAKIEKATRVQGIATTCSEFRLGDEALVAFANQILVPSFSMGDYSQLHNSCLVSGYKPTVIGHNCWIGQSSILNSTEDLRIGNNVRIGTGSQLWTHVASGEVLEGCTLLGFSPLNLEDNVWIVGGAVISPGLTLKRNSVVMTGSVLTKSTEAFHTYAGVPARDITDKINCWKDVDLSWKLNYLKAVVVEFLETTKIDPNAINILDELECENPLQSSSESLLFVGKIDVGSVLSRKSPQVSVFDLDSKFYLKTRSSLEKKFIKFCVGYRARFLPFGE